MVPPRGVRPGDLLVVIHDFDSRGEDELTLRRGEKIELVELDDGFGDGWYLGRHLGTETTGLFPGIYTAATAKTPLQQRPDPPRMVKATLQHDGEDAYDSPPEEESRTESQTAEDNTPHASRPASASDMSKPEGQTSLSRYQQRSSSSPLPATLATDIQQKIDNHLNGEDSPVMDETLSVIDEHIRDLSTPRHSMAPHDHRAATDSSSEYSSHMSHRLSYINGHETDEEEESVPTEEEVRNWDHAMTAKQLRALEVEERHCQIFEEQEIAGDVLLDMDQNFLFMKEFDFGVMGRRLKTWHKIKAFQEEVKGLRRPRQSSASNISGPVGAPDERPMSRANAGPLLPRIPSLVDRGAYHHQQRTSSVSAQNPKRANSTRISGTSSPSTPATPSYGLESPLRPSAASIRQLGHSRRHSSIDATGKSPVPSEMSSSLRGNHRGKPSFDRFWSMSVSGQPPVETPTEGSLTPYVYHTNTNGSDSAISVDDKHGDLDRGYFSQTEVDSRKNRRLLKKRRSSGGIGHSRTPSFASKANPGSKRHSRIGSADSIRDAADHLSAAAKASSPKERFKSFGSRRSGQHSQLSTDDKPAISSGFFSSRAPSLGKSDRGTASIHPLSFHSVNATGDRFRRAMGLRVASDFATKGIDTAVASASPLTEQGPSSARAESTTPSAKSSERHSTDTSSKTVEDGTSLVRAKTSSVKGGVKSKKDTSAYMQGLEKKTPQEQMVGCDYSGWMKKRSSHLVATWKPRLFVLRGRRLSYYYSLNDTEERGLIDITAHRVLRADTDPLIAIHATITGATVSPTSLSNVHASESTADDAPGSPEANRGTGGPFFFKLAPPKGGASRTVQFTKPTVHYFQVDNIKEGRLWMAALMKATIERDLSKPVESTNKQRTVSLRQARKMNQRPPALIDMPIYETEKYQSTEEESKDLMVKGLNLDKAVARDNNNDGSKNHRHRRSTSGSMVDPASLPSEALAALRSS
ncbi:polar growth protein [Monascus purpureus]|uniref:Polar growth protein n=1 Tax=Monascus purpureus TaxID=5098 RepID=A0A507QKE9_MONPU|nr:polar growth protein [Monascus purpureus]